MIEYQARLAAYLLAVLGACASASVMADAIYKSKDSRGRFHYSERPLPGTITIEQVTIEPPQPKDAARPGAGREQARRQAAQSLSRERALDEALAEVSAAADALDQARRRRDAGVEPLPGERLGNAGGGSRLAPAYVERQEALERELGAAQQRLERAYARRNELR